MREIELLAPAKSYEAVVAAVDHGADAIYMGGTRFGARVGACNSMDDMARAVEYAHQYGVRLYATLNTLIFEEELGEAESVAREVVSTGVDALIIQDLAFARMGLGVELHASTQMCNSTVEGVRFLSELGFKRIVMERNLSFERLSDIARAVPDVDMEVFVHGAICVGQSGRCLLSRSMTPQRSGNRGGCSQPCRVPYDLCDEAGRAILSGQHLLSVRDLNLSQRIGDLLDIGVRSFKIEGRLKDLSYTKNIVSHYRRVIDNELRGREGLCRSSDGNSRIEFEPNPAKSFSRGETIYMFDGQSRGVASFDTPKAVGEAIGEVRAVRRGGEVIEVRLYRGVELSTGDGVCYITDEGLQGGNINRVDGGAGDVISLSKRVDVRVGTILYRNFDRKFELMLDGSRTRRTISVSASIESSAERVEVVYRDERGAESRGVLEGVFEQAQNRDKMSQTIRSQLAKCGDTIFEATKIDLSGWGGEFLAASQLSALRREALTMLRTERLRRASERVCRDFEEREWARYPHCEVGGEVGVTNSLSRGLYMDHGAVSIAPSFEQRDSFEGVEVLRSSYCIRNEMGECLRGGSGLRGDLFLVRGQHRYRLNFECDKCEMTLIAER